MRMRNVLFRIHKNVLFFGHPRLWPRPADGAYETPILPSQLRRKTILPFPTSSTHTVFRMSASRSPSTFGPCLRPWRNPMGESNPPVSGQGSRVTTRSGQNVLVAKKLSRKPSEIKPRLLLDWIGSHTLVYRLPWSSISPDHRKEPKFLVGGGIPFNFVSIGAKRLIVSVHITSRLSTRPSPASGRYTGWATNMIPLVHVLHCTRGIFGPPGRLRNRKPRPDPTTLPHFR